MIAALLIATAAAALPAGETAIPYVSSNGVEQWKVDADRGIWIKSITGKWYYGSFMGRCPRAAGAISLGFQTSALDQLDRHGAILAEGSRCPLTSLVRSEGPLKRK